MAMPHGIAVRTVGQVLSRTPHEVTMRKIMLMLEWIYDQIVYPFTAAFQRNDDDDDGTQP